MARAAKTKHGDQFIIFSLRIDADVLAQIKKHADANFRTTTGEIQRRLIASLKGTKRRSLQATAE